MKPTIPLTVCLLATIGSVFGESLTIGTSQQPGRMDHEQANIGAPIEGLICGNIYPASAFLVPPENQGQLQQALEANNSVRLLPGDYGPGSLTVRSGQKVYGLPGTKLGQIVVEPGSSGVVISCVQADVVFPKSDKITRANAIFRVAGSLIVKGGTLEDNLFVDSLAVDVDTVSSGYMRNNRFIRAPGQIQGNRMLKFLGNPMQPSFGNVFLWVNACTNDGPSIQISGVRDMSIALVDAEMWSAKSKTPLPLFNVTKTDRLNIFAAQGGRYDPDPERRKQFGLLETNAKEVRVFGMAIRSRGQPADTLPAKIRLGKGNLRSLFVDSLAYSFSLPSSSSLNVRVFERIKSVAGTDLPSAPLEYSVGKLHVVPANALETTGSALSKMILQSGSKTIPWQRPTFPAVLMTSDDGLANNASQDDTQGLQERLDKEGMVVLGPGKFYISAPLRINRNKGLIGSGMDQTVIIAKDPNLSMFIYDPEGNTRAVSLANLTLQGGGVGVHLRGTEVKPNISKAFLSHITFRNMSTAGVYVDIPGSDTASPENSLPANCQSMDNNLISFCNFIQCAAGLKQRKPPQMGRYGFIDKLVVYRCQFLQCGIGIDFPATRPNNLCTYIECHFAGCTKAAARFVNNFTPTFANCDFTGCGGDPLVDSELPVNFMSCHFASNTTAKALLPPQSVAEGCSFESSPSSTTTVLGTPIRNDFYNCSVDLPLGPLKDGLFMNSRVADQQDLSQVMVQVVAGKHITLVKGAVAPCPQFLVTGTSDPTH